MERVGEAAQRVLSVVDQSALAMYFGMARDNTDAADKAAAKKEAAERVEQRSALRTAMLARANALAPSDIAKDGRHDSEGLTE